MVSHMWLDILSRSIVDLNLVDLDLVDLDLVDLDLADLWQVESWRLFESATERAFKRPARQSTTRHKSRD